MVERQPWRRLAAGAAAASLASSASAMRSRSSSESCSRSALKRHAVRGETRCSIQPSVTVRCCAWSTCGRSGGRGGEKVCQRGVSGRAGGRVEWGTGPEAAYARLPTPQRNEHVDGGIRSSADAAARRARRRRRAACLHSVTSAPPTTMSSNKSNVAAIEKAREESKSILPILRVSRIELLHRDLGNSDCSTSP